MCDGWIMRVDVEDVSFVRAWCVVVSEKEGGRSLGGGETLPKKNENAKKEKKRTITRPLRLAANTRIPRENGRTS